MSITAGIDVGSTYTKAVVLQDDSDRRPRHGSPPASSSTEVSERRSTMRWQTRASTVDDVEYRIATGFGRHQATQATSHVTDLTAAARGAAFLFPGTRTVLDIGGQTMKASRLDESARVKSFRLNDKCAAGTGAFLEKTARYMGLRDRGDRSARGHLQGGS